MLNRTAITVKAKQPVLDWLLNLPDPVDSAITLEVINEDRPVYLVPECIGPGKFPELLSLYVDLIFDSELGGWWTDRADWPEPRNLELFYHWFDVEFHSMIEDLTNEELVDED